MAAETLTCRVCLGAFSELERRPKIVPCGKHTVCLSCLKYFQANEGRIKCPECQVIYWEAPEGLNDNLTIIGMLEDLNLRCATHDTRAVSFCSDHFKPQCDKCTEHAGCTLLDIVESSQEINFSVIEKIVELQRKVEAVGTRVPPTIAPKVRDCRREILKTNYTTYLSLLQLLPQVSCDRCRMRDGLRLERAGLSVICVHCLTPGSDPKEFITLDDERAAITQLSVIVKEMLRGVNVDELTPESLKGFKTMESLSLLDILNFAKPLKNKKREKTKYENLPSEFLCLDCGSLLRKANSRVRELTCRGMHVICEDCCSRMSSIQTICPLDGNVFGYSPTSLTQHPAPQHEAVDPAGYQYAQYQAAQYQPAQYQADPYQAAQYQPVQYQYQPDQYQPAQYQYQPDQYQQLLQWRLNQARMQGPRYSPAGLLEQMPAMPGLPQQMAYGLPPQVPVAPAPQAAEIPVYPPEPRPDRPAEVPRPPPPTQVKRDTQHPNTPMPPFQPPANQQYLDRFVSVMPEMGLPESRMTADTKGWTIQCAKNQVEAMTMQCFGDVMLRGIAVANPVTAGVVAKLKFIKIYSSRNTKGRPIFEQTPNTDLIGGNNILTYVQLSQPVQIPAFQERAIKIKIAPPAGHGDNLMLYRGNPFDRPDTWNGSDHMTWEFDEVREADLESGEYTNGQNNFSGPILRLIYST